MDPSTSAPLAHEDAHVLCLPGHSHYLLVLVRSDLEAALLQTACYSQMSPHSYQGYPQYLSSRCTTALRSGGRPLGLEILDVPAYILTSPMTSAE
jgi:hypothetical protein